MIKNWEKIVFQSLLFELILILLSAHQLEAQDFTLKKVSDFPYELKAEQEMGLMLTGTGLLYGSALGQMNKQKWGNIPISRLNPKDVWFLDRPATNYYTKRLNKWREFLEPGTSLATLGLIGTYGITSFFQNKNWYELMTLTLMYMEGLYISTGSELLVKALVNRPRPYTYNLDLPLSERTRGGNNESFFSGNATLLFYNAAFISLTAYDLFDDSRLTAYLIGATFGLAELSAFWSVRSGMHFPTDVLTGAIWGSGTALLINKLHKKGAKGLNIMPWAIKKGRGLAIRYLIQ